MVISTLIALATFYKDFKNIKFDHVRTYDTRVTAIKSVF